MQKGEQAPLPSPPVALCPSLPVPAATYTGRLGDSSSVAAPPPPVALGFPTGLPAEGVVSVVGAASAHFPLGSPGNHQTVTTPDVNSAAPSDELCIPLRGLGWLTGLAVPRASSLTGRTGDLQPHCPQGLCGCQSGTRGARLCWVGQVDAARFKIRCGSQMRHSPLFPYHVGQFSIRMLPRKLTAKLLKKIQLLIFT